MIRIKRSDLRAVMAGLLFGLVLAREGRAQNGDLKSDMWVATDALSRKLPTYHDCGPPRAGKTVGIFYFLWLGQHGTAGPYDITNILAANPSNPQWGPVSAFHHWHESELGYYLSNDDYVIRKHCSMLVDAGIDVIVFDVTNAFTYQNNYLLVCSIYNQIRTAGGRTPQIAFLAHSSSASVVQNLYDNFYSKNLYPDLWFRWLGKPLMMSSPDGLSASVQSFFTFRESWAWTNGGWFGSGQDKWPWLDNYPQHYGWHTPGVPEQVSVCVAQHPVSNIGRSSANQIEPPQAQWKTAEGPCFDQQWKGALSIDPQFIFITGWNEWVAQRFVDTAGGQPFLGSPLPPGGTFFVDTFVQEYSRDIEPMKGGHTDNYYYQMIANIRKFKGVRAPELPSTPQTIAVDGLFGDWDSVGPEYRDTIGDTIARSHAGWGSAGTYTNTTGRNDIAACKVARDDTYVFFYVRTQLPITPRTGSNWMLLFIDSDADHSTGWEGYDYLVNYPPSSSSTTPVKRNTGGWSWSTVASATYAMVGTQMELRIPRSAIGQSASETTLDFHWADNIQSTNDIIEFSVSGDSAPNRRFNYRYNTDLTPPDPVSDLVAVRTQTQLVVSWKNPVALDLLGTMVRFRTDRFPTSLTDGQLLCDRTAAPDQADAFPQASVIRTAAYYYAAFAYDRMQNYSTSAQVLAPPLARADFDGDGDVDQSDYGFFQGCTSGTAIYYTKNICGLSDFDRDGDVDLDDLNKFQHCFNGPNRTTALDCVE